MSSPVPQTSSFLLGAAAPRYRGDLLHVYPTSQRHWLPAHRSRTHSSDTGRACALVRGLGAAAVLKGRWVSELKGPFWCFRLRHRMRGDRVLWIPGSDHAGIATQVGLLSRFPFSVNGAVFIRSTLTSFSSALDSTPGCGGETPVEGAGREETRAEPGRLPQGRVAVEARVRGRGL